MIPTKARDNRRIKALKLSKNLERRYKEVKCRECTVVVTPMDFAKILGKFTKVKIQYERSSKSKPKQTHAVSPNSRLIKAKENGMVQIHRSAFNAHPAQKLLGLKKSKAPPTPTSNVLKENNILKKPELKTLDSPSKKQEIKSNDKQYKIVFDSPACEKKEENNKLSLQDLITDINKNILPSADWAIDYFPKSGEPKDDKIYDRIAAELEDLMYNEKVKSDDKDSKNEEFPSILDILNENTKDGSAKNSNQANTITLESSDVEAMLMGNSNQPTEPTPMEVDDTGVSSFINAVAKKQSENEAASTIDENPESPSILEEPEMKETPVAEAAKPLEESKTQSLSSLQNDKIDKNDKTNSNNKNSSTKTVVTQIVFRKTVNGTCSKTVTCPKNLKYGITMQGKSVELIGAPSHIASLEDLQVLLQIVEESELNDLHILH